MSALTLAELAAAAGDDSHDAIQHVLDSLPDPADRREFLRGLMERILMADAEPGEASEGEVSRWVGSWVLSSVLARSAHFHAADAETDRMIDRGDAGIVATGRQLRDRYASAR